jgi:hypothetical protein
MRKNRVKFVRVGYGRFVNVIVMMTAPKNAKDKRALAVLNIRNLRTYGRFINKMKFIRQSMKENASSFPFPPISVADSGTFDNDIEAMDAAETSALTKAIGTASARDVEMQTVLDDVHGLQGYVQFLADKLHDTQKAVALIQISGFDVSLREPHSKSDFTAKNTTISGTVKLMINVKKATNGEKRYSVKWESSTDEGKTPVALPTTIKGNTLVPGLTPGTWMWFRFMVVLKDGEHSWSDWIKILVK